MRWMTCCWLGLALLACDDTPLASPVDLALHPPDAGAPDHGPDAYVVPPQPEMRGCAPAPVDFDALPDLTVRELWASPPVQGPVAVHQPTVDPSYWIAEAGGRLLRADVAVDTTLHDYGRLTDGAAHLLAVAFAPDFTDHGALYSLQAQGGAVVVVQHHVAAGTGWVQRVDDVEVLRRPVSGPPRGSLAAGPEGVVAALPPGPDAPAGVWQVDASPPQPLPGEWRSPSGCAPDPAGGLWCVDQRPEADALVRVHAGEAHLQVEWPAQPECHRQLGPMYRGAEAPLLWGGLITYDPCAQTVFVSKRTGDGRLVDAPALAVDGPAVFGTGWAGRPLALTPGALGRLVEAAPDHALGWPQRLSDTGCFTALAPLRPAPGVLPYALRSPLWTDGAVKRRFVAVPPGHAVQASADGQLDFPVGSVVLKDFAFPAPDGLRSVETRVMTRHPFGWSFHTFRWDEDGRDATLLDGAEATWRALDLPGGEALRYLYPSRSNCLACHDPLGPTLLGPTLSQLAQPDGLGPVPAWRRAGLLAGAPSPAPMPDPADPALPVADRARAYLHANCAHCHRPGGWTPPSLGMDLRFETPLGQMGVCDVPRRYASFGVPGDTRLDPGDPGNSYLLQRMLHRGYGQMPPVATERVDPLVEPLFTAWIDALVCP